MKAKAEKTIRLERPYIGKIVTIEEQTVEFDNGNMAYREIARHCGGVGILAINRRDEIYLVNQYRKPYDEFLLEIPAGKLEPDEDPEECARRELLEETGIESITLEKLSEIYPSPGFLDERLFVFRTLDFKEGGAAAPDEDEYLDVVIMPFSMALQKVHAMEIRDAKTVVAILIEATKRMMEK